MLYLRMLSHYNWNRLKGSKLKFIYRIWNSVAAEEEGKERIRQKKIWSLTQWTAAGTSHTSSWQRSSSAERTMNYPYYLSCFRWHSIYSVSQKKSPPYGFLKFFPKRLEIFNQFFTHLLCDHFYTRVQIFIQISPTLTKLCHTKRDHLAKFYISLEL